MVHPFDRIGLAALSDLGDPAVRSLIGTLEKTQEEFLARESKFRSPDYKWPRDALHTWSRIWEYPYVVHHLAKRKPTGRPVVVDHGCGTTFFPYSATSVGYDVIGVDNDPVCLNDFAAAATVVPHDGALAARRLEPNGRLPLESASADAVASISVLEHIPDPVPAVAEIMRVLRPGGLFVLTMDVDLWGRGELSAVKYRQIRELLAAHFTCDLPEVTVHPLDHLTSRNSPHPPGWMNLGTSAVLHGKHWFKQTAGLALGRKPHFKYHRREPFHLSVFGYVGTRK
jgi:SAM-dependent methyltransferase